MQKRLIKRLAKLTCKIDLQNWLAKKTCKKSLTKNNEKQQLKTIAKNAFFSILSISVINTWEKPCKNLEKKDLQFIKEMKKQDLKKDWSVAKKDLQQKTANKRLGIKTCYEDFSKRLAKKPTETDYQRNFWFF